MKKLLISLAALLAPLALMAMEHPKEHPTETPEKKAEVKEPAKPAEQTKAKYPKELNKEYAAAVEDYVKQAQAKGGFKVHDDVLNKDWTLQLVGVHKDRVAHLADNRFFACADFKAVGEKGKVDLDFYAKKDGTWAVEKVMVHKVNGKPRYTYNEKNEIVPSKG